MRFSVFVMLIGASQAIKMSLKANAKTDVEETAMTQVRGKQEFPPDDFEAVELEDYPELNPPMHQYVEEEEEDSSLVSPAGNPDKLISSGISGNEQDESVGE